MHATLFRFPAGTDRREIAKQLYVMRRELLERVDKIELHLLGVAPCT